MSASNGNNTSDGGNGGTIVDPSVAPEILNLSVRGKLKVDDALSGEYTFDPKTGDTTDSSVFAWGHKDTTESALGSSPTTVTVSGNVTPYTITKADAGAVLELSVKAKNGADVEGNTLKVDTSMSGNGNNTSDGGNGGTIVDPTVPPEILNLSVRGKLKVDETLSGEYTFDPKAGDTTDSSVFAWGHKGTTESALLSSPTTVTVSGNVVPYTITEADAGAVLELSVKAKNGANVEGNTLKVDTSMSGNGNNTSEGGQGGTIINPEAEPKVSGLKVSGPLSLGGILSGEYTFNANNGDPDDRSTFAWSSAGNSVNNAPNGSTVQVSGKVDDYTISASDSGKFIELAVTPKNSLNKVGQTEMVGTKSPAGLTLSNVSASSSALPLPGSPGWIWVVDGNNISATGEFTFANKNPISVSNNGTGKIRVNIDDLIHNIRFNGVVIDMSSCSPYFQDTYCEYDIPLSSTGNRIEIDAENQGSPSPNNYGSLTVQVLDSSSTVLLDTSDPTKWDYRN
ncbi:hypothetical protein [Serratia fonticola]